MRDKGFEVGDIVTEAIGVRRDMCAVAVPAMVNRDDVVVGADCGGEDVPASRAVLQAV